MNSLDVDEDTKEETVIRLNRKTMLRLQICLENTKIAKRRRHF